MICFQAFFDRTIFSPKPGLKLKIFTAFCSLGGKPRMQLGSHFCETVKFQTSCGYNCTNCHDWTWYGAGTFQGLLTGLLQNRAWYIWKYFHDFQVLRDPLLCALSGKTCTEGVWNFTWTCHSFLWLQEPKNGKH